MIKSPPQAVLVQPHVLVLSNTEIIGEFSFVGMVFPQGLGREARQADRHEEGKGRHRPKDRSHPSLHPGRWHILRLGAVAVSLIFEASARRIKGRTVECLKKGKTLLRRRRIRSVLQGRLTLIMHRCLLLISIASIFAQATSSTRRGRTGARHHGGSRVGLRLLPR
jgi:hypothetical protein